MSLSAQSVRPSYDYGYGATSASDFRDGQMLFSRVRSDLDCAEENLPPFAAGSRSDFDRVRGELSELQRQWDENAYQPRQSDTVITALDRALDSSQLSLRDRDRLSSDLRSPRDFRDSHE
jgi:hypothetical protein